MGAEPEPAWMSRLHSAAPNVQPLPYVACNLLHVAAASSKPTVESGTQSQSSTSLLLSRVLGEMDTIMAVSRDDTPKPDSVSNDQDTATMEPLSLLTLDQIVVGIRPLLITHRSNIAAHQHGQALLDGLRRLLSALFERYGPPTLLLHISSIAAVHHVLPQVQRSVQQIDPPSTQLVEPYDYFKRACEELVESLATSCTSASSAFSSSPTTPNKNIQWTNVRLGAIFSDATTCIQCNALSLQWYTGGPYLPTRIDCISSRNACHLIHLILLKHVSSHQTSSSSTTTTVEPLLPVYYYTRCVSQYPQPVPYGEFLLAYCEANLNGTSGAQPLSHSVAGGGLAGYRRHLWLPHWLVRYGFVLPFSLVHCTLGQGMAVERSIYGIARLFAPSHGPRTFV
jgi:hypothetical protein